MRPTIVELFAGAFVCWSAAFAQPSGQPAPVLDLTVNESGEAQLFSGWPVLLELGISHPDLFDTNTLPIPLKADSGTWASLLRIDVRDAAGASVSWPFALLNTPGRELVLDGDRLGELEWTLSPAQTAAVPPGVYTLRVTLDATGVTNSDGWKGRVRAGPLKVQIAAEPASLTPAELEQKQRLLAEYELARGNTSAALQSIEDLLRADPNNIAGLTFKAALLREQGKEEEALACVRQALSRIRAANTNAPEPPRELLRQQFELTELLLPRRIKSLGLANGILTLQWNTTPGDTYNVEGSPDLTNWTIRATGLLANTNSFLWSTNRLLDREFFRIRP